MASTPEDIRSWPPDARRDHDALFAPAPEPGPSLADLMLTVLDEVPGPPEWATRASTRIRVASPTARDDVAVAVYEELAASVAGAYATIARWLKP